MSASHPSPCKTCDGSGEVETGQTTSARCYNCKGTGVHPSEAEGRTPTPDDQLDELREYAIDHMRGYGMESRLAIGFLTFDALLAARSPAPSDEPRRCTCPGPWRADPRIHEHDCYLRPAAPSVEARDDMETAIAVLRQAGYGPLADRLAARL